MAAIPTRTALCLAGGGITGSMFEIGALKALDDFYEDSFCVNGFDIFVGISAGAIISTLIANGYKAEEMYDAIGQNQNSPLNFSRKDIYNLRLSEFAKAVAPLFFRLPSLIKYGWRNRDHASVMDLLSIMQEFLPPGIFSLVNLDKYMSKVLYPEGRTNDFRNLKKELYIPATDLDSGKRWIFGDDDDTVPISKAVAASAAIPMFFRPFHIKGRDYVDGAIGQVSHMDIAIEKGAKLIVIINPTAPIENIENKSYLPTFDGTCPNISKKGMGFISEQARRIETKTRFELGFERFRNAHPNVDFIVLQPSPSDAFLLLHGVMEFASRKSILEYGYYSTITALKTNFLKYSEVFARHNIGISEKFLTKKSASTA